MQASLRSLRTRGCAAPGRMRGEAVLLRSGLRRGTPHLLPQGEKASFSAKNFIVRTASADEHRETHVRIVAQSALRSSEGSRKAWNLARYSAAAAAVTITHTSPGLGGRGARWRPGAVKALKREYEPSGPRFQVACKKVRPFADDIHR